MADHSIIAPFVLKWEGGLGSSSADAHADDIGVLPYHVNKGVTWRTYQSLAPTLGVNPSYDAFKSMSDTTFKKFLKHFWDKATYNNSINSQRVSEVVYTWYWGSGAYGISSLQRFINTKTHLVGYSIGVDGGMGPQTVGALNKLIESSDEDKLIVELNDHRERYFKSLNSPYERGWLNRLDDFRLRWWSDGEEKKKIQTGFIALAVVLLLMLFSIWIVKNNQDGKWSKK